MNPYIIALLVMAALNGVWDGATSSFKRPKTVNHGDGTFSLHKTWTIYRFWPLSALFIIELVLMTLSGQTLRQLLVPAIAACVIELVLRWLASHLTPLHGSTKH